MNWWSWGGLSPLLKFRRFLNPEIPTAEVALLHALLMLPRKTRSLVLLCLAAILLCGGISSNADVPPETSGQIDALLQTHWKATNQSPNEPVSDPVFLRRVFLDIAGRIPTVTEAQNFLSDQRPSRRALLIQQLPESETYVAAFYPFWADILRLIEVQPNTQGVSNAAYERYVKESLRRNKPFDVFARKLLSAKSDAFENGAVGGGSPICRGPLPAHLFWFCRGSGKR